MSNIEEPVKTESIAPVETLMPAVEPIKEKRKCSEAQLANLARARVARAEKVKKVNAERKAKTEEEGKNDLKAEIEKMVQERLAAERAEQEVKAPKKKVVPKSASKPKSKPKPKPKIIESDSEEESDNEPRAPTRSQSQPQPAAQNVYDPYASICH